MAQTASDYLLARLADWGVHVVFGYPGNGINELVAAWGRRDAPPRFVQARHEEMSAFEAVGYAKLTGPGWVLPAGGRPDQPVQGRRP
jgi:pyruvate dehydrogenase (quinone)